MNERPASLWLEALRGKCQPGESPADLITRKPGTVTLAELDREAKRLQTRLDWARRQAIDQVKRAEAIKAELATLAAIRESRARLYRSSG